MKRKYRKSRVKKKITKKKKKNFLLVFLLGFFRFCFKILLILILTLVVTFFVFKLILPFFFSFSGNRNLLFLNLNSQRELQELGLLKINLNFDRAVFINLSNDYQVESTSSGQLTNLKDWYFEMQSQCQNKDCQKNHFEYIFKENIDNLIFVKTNLKNVSSWSNLIKIVNRELLFNFKKIFFNFDLFEWLVLFNNVTIGDFQIIESNYKINDNQFFNIETNVNLFQCPLAVLNGSGVQGISWKFVDSLEKKGFLITHINSHDEVLEKTKIYYSGENNQCLKSIKDYKFLLPLDSSLEINSDLTQEKRCQVVIILGKDAINY